MKSLQVLVCGGDSQALQKVARRLSDKGVEAKTSTNDYLHLEVAELWY